MSLTSRLDHPAASATGWFSLFVAAGIPFGAALIAAYQIQQGRCTGWSFQWTFAPLVAACDPTQALRGWGWAATYAIFVAYAVAVVIGFAKIAGVLRRGVPGADSSAAANAIEAWTLVAAVLAFPITIWLILSTDPDELWGRSSWIFFASVSCLIVLICVRVLRRILLLRARRNSS